LADVYFAVAHNLREQRPEQYYVSRSDAQPSRPKFRFLQTNAFWFDFVFQAHLMSFISGQHGKHSNNPCIPAPLTLKVSLEELCHGQSKESFI
jgi:hypothetical protein